MGAGYGIRRTDRDYELASVGRELERWEGVVVVKDRQEKVLSLAAARSFEVYDQEQLELAVGDTIRITKNFQGPGQQFRNNELCTVAAIASDSIMLEDGRQIKRFGPLHVDQGIVVTSFAAQGGGGTRARSEQNERNGNMSISPSTPTLREIYEPARRSRAWDLATTEVMRFWTDDGNCYGFIFHHLTATHYNARLQRLLIDWAL